MKKRGFLSTGLVLSLALTMAFVPAACQKTDGLNGSEGTLMETEAIPEKYSLVDENRITGFRNQHQSGLCWAYAAAAAAESSLITEGFEDASTDLSEGHICLCVYPFAEDREEGSTEDGFYIVGNKKANIMTPFYFGGMSSLAAQMFALGYGPVYESEAPLNTDAGELRKSVEKIVKDNEDGILPKETGKYLLTEANLYESDEDIKRAILENGAVCTGIILDSKGSGKDRNGQLNFYGHDREKTAPETLTNHVVTLAGWDDAYSKDEFSVKPSKNGAWLVKDSGSYAKSEAEGYFWMSYEEYHLGTMGMSFCKRQDYGRILSYDLVGPADGIRSDGESTVIANVFYPEAACAVKGIGLGTQVPDQKLKLIAYKNPETEKPDGGEKLFEKEYVIAHAGYHVVDLDQPAELAAEDSFSVVVSYENRDGEEKIAPVEGDSSILGSNPLGELYLVSREGESYAMNDGKWYDLSRPESSAVFGKTGTINNASIKALIK